MKHLFRLLKCFKFARKKLGGIWYYVELIGSAGGIESPLKYWTQEVDDQMEVMKEERYD